MHEVCLFIFDKAVLNQTFLRAAGGRAELPCRWRINRPAAELVVDSSQLYFSNMSFFSQSAQRPHKRHPMAARKEQLFSLFFVA